MYTTTIRLCATCAYSLLIGLLCWVGYSPVLGQSLPTGFNSVKTQDGYTTPMGVLFNGQQQFLWDKAGRIWVSTWNGTQYAKQTAAVLDISPEVGNWRDFGLMSIALDPSFQTNGYVYLYYVVDRHHLMNFRPDAANPNNPALPTSYSATANTYYQATIGRITRYRLVNTNGVFSTDYASRRILLGESKKTGVPLTHESHAGGSMVFGRDGTLLVTTGDNASYSGIDKGSAGETYFQQAINDTIMTTSENVGAFRSQMLTSLCGKVLRLDPATGNGVSSNRHYDAANPRSARSRMWALGFRNPFRMNIQPNTGSTNPADANPGTLFVNDVGWGTWEDLHVIGQGGGQNAGWPLFEGITRHTNYSNAATTLENKDEPNPANTCNKPFLTFGDLLRDATPTSVTVTNPCNTTLALPGDQRRMNHSRPAIDWRHGTALARIPTFGAQGVPTATSITAGGIGASFQGNCASGVAYYPANTAFPGEWHNTLFFADYGANWIRAATLDANGAITQVREFLPSGVGRGIVDVKYNALDGALYYTNINTGELMKISYGGNRPPVAVASASSLTGTSPLSVTFTGSNSSDPDSNTLTYLWDFGDGTSSTVANPTKVFSSSVARGYTVRLTVTDNLGLTDSKTLQVSINNAAPTARISNPLNNAKYRLDQASSYTLTANVTDEAPASLTYAWQVTLRHNNHEHREPVDNRVSPVIQVSPVGCDGETYYYLINLTVTDLGGLTTSDSVKIYPDCNSGSLAVTGLTATTVSSGSVRLNWTNPTVSFDNVLVVGKAGSGFTNKPDQPSYTANSSFTANGAAFDGGKVLYQGVSTSLVITDLTAGQPYFFRVYTRKGTAWTGGVEVSATTTQAQTPPTSVTAVEPFKCYRFVSRVSGKVLSVEANSQDDGAQIRQRTDGNQLAQRWRFTPLDGGFYKIAAVHSEKAIDVWWGSQNDGIGIQQWNFNPWAQQQQFSLSRNAEGFFTITARHSGKALDVQNANQTEGGMVIQYTPNGTPNQQWRFEETSCTTGLPISGTTTTPPTSTTTTPPTSVTVIDVAKCYRLQSRASGLVLNVPSGLGDDGISLRQNTNAERPWQKWRFTPIDGGYYRISVLHNLKGIQVANSAGTDDALLQQWTYWGGGHQQWSVARNAEGFYTMSNRNSGKAITVRGASTAEGAEISQQTLGSGTHQQWSITETTCPAGARVGVKELGTLFSLMPNPAHDHVLIDLSPVANVPVGLTLSDITGRPLRSEYVEAAPTTPHRFELGQSTRGALPSGLYLLQISPAGEPPTTLRVVVQQ
jgi:glucose/arabinose dehydrogenase